MLYYLGRQDPNDSHLNGESWHIVGPDVWTATGFFATWAEAKEYIDFKNQQQSQNFSTQSWRLAENYMEQIAAEVHNQWWQEKEKQGFHPPMACVNLLEIEQDPKFSRRCEWCHADMYPYGELPEHVKEYDRVTVRGVLSAVDKITVKPEKEKEKE